MTRVTVKIGDEERLLDLVDEGWINQQINKRREHGEVVCVRVRIEDADLHLSLSTPTCASGSGQGGGRAPNTEESRIVDLWNRRGLNSPEFNGGSLVSFLKQLRDLT